MDMVLEKEQLRTRIEALQSKKEELKQNIKYLKNAEKEFQRMHDENEKKLKILRDTRVFLIRKNDGERRMLAAEKAVILKVFEERKIHDVFRGQHINLYEIPRVFNEKMELLQNYCVAFETASRFIAAFEKVVLEHPMAKETKQDKERLRAAGNLRNVSWEAIRVFREKPEVRRLEKKLKVLDQQFQKALADFNLVTNQQEKIHNLI